MALIQSRKVLVTGGAGRTGALVVKKLLARPKEFSVVAGVRSQESAAKLTATVDNEPVQTAIVDISSSESELHSELASALNGCAALIIVTSAVPEVIPQAAGAAPGPPSFKWKGDQAPEKVDWLGCKAQIDAAKAAGVQHVVLVGSMGGTNPDHSLNKIAGGNILQFKRKAEQYLVKSGLTYTIIHPGGLIDQPGGERQLLVGVDDVLVNGEFRTVPRNDVAEVCVQSLLEPGFANRAIDLSSMPPGSGVVTTDFAALIAGMDKTYDWSINSQW
eukprot:CAMPEP_0119106796 /NCGR_PEP_ID=MMETSP1180-20130426/6323_1 /TAXON_ID=3052 ORGANISM="Chlamydomonas cf sp, Strain CCMP681" /NCGR_SAMPLE_ID=MMETSP1180 /ASSEMBLY_ACC=CAM_ASM_000741 /LENGTH=273 /DNA_ID=CAMNT_0007092183 /DNA_START=48 /DNA_END=869 /DNA_ORIENTATION=+